MLRQSVLDYLLDYAERRPSHTAVLTKRNGAYCPVTWSELALAAKQVATGLIKLGVKPGDRVSIASQTRLEWLTIDYGILHAGAVTVPIYPSNLPDECQHIIDNSGATIVFAEDAVQVQKFRAERPHLPKLEKVIQIAGEVREDDGWVMPLRELMDCGALDEATLEMRRRSLNKDSILTIIYTSGTTGRPKGVVTTHDNMLYEAEAIREIDVVRENDIQLLFLPLAHSFAKVLQMAWLASGHVLAIAESMQTLRDNMMEVRPTVLAGVPRVFEKFYGAVVQKGMQAGGVRAKLFARAVELSEKAGEAEREGQPLSPVDALQFRLLRRVVLGQVSKGLKKTLGGRMRVLVSGGAPLAPKIAWLFRDVDCDILEGFGLTETSAATCVNRVGHNRVGTVGPPMPGTEAKIAADGELLLRGRGVMRGYWMNDEATAEVLKDGWFLTGDVAAITPEGCIRILDRKKDLIVTAGGKNVAPQKIENLVKTDKLISQVVVHGDKRNFLTALITLDPDALKGFATEHSLGNASYAELTQRPEVYRAVSGAVDGFNRQLAKYETIKKFKILEHDFSQESGELTPSLKIKRKLVNQRYKTTFDAFYEEQY